MDTHEQRVFQSFRRVQGWFEANSQSLSSASPEVSTALAGHLDTLRAVIERLTGYVAQQETEADQTKLISKDEKELRREVLSHHMSTIVKTARSLRGIAPGIGILALPKTNISTPNLITAAAVMAQKAEIYRSILVENGLPSDFVEQLLDSASRLRASLDARGLARGSRRAAAEGVQTEIRLGRRVVAIMDASLKRVLRREPVKWAEWRHVQRVTQRGHVSKEIATGTELQRTVLGGAPTALGVTPTEVVASPTVQEKAA